MRIDLIGDPIGLQPVYEAAGSQQDNLCGVYWADNAIQSLTAHRYPDEEDAALVAGSVVPAGGTDPAASFPWGGRAPSGPIESSMPYRLTIPTSTDDDALGTSAAGVGRAIERLSHGDLAVVPLRHDRWTADGVVALVDALAGLGTASLIAIANVFTGPFVTSRHSTATLLAYLDAGTPMPDTPGDWAVGHFVSLAGVVHGAVNPLVIVRDTYRALGRRGYHLQPAACVAAALHRDGSGAGGVILAGSPDTVAAARIAVHGAVAGLVEEWWDNGSPPPAD